MLGGRASSCSASGSLPTVRHASDGHAVGRRRADLMALACSKSREFAPRAASLLPGLRPTLGHFAAGGGGERSRQHLAARRSSCHGPLSGHARGCRFAILIAILVPAKASRVSVVT